jgi:hypothetical protein
MLYIVFLLHARDANLEFLNDCGKLQEAQIKLKH